MEIDLNSEDSSKWCNPKKRKIIKVETETNDNKKIIDKSIAETTRNYSVIKSKESNSSEKKIKVEGENDNKKIINKSIAEIIKNGSNIEYKESNDSKNSKKIKVEVENDDKDIIDKTLTGTIKKHLHVEYKESNGSEISNNIKVEIENDDKKIIVKSVAGTRRNHSDIESEESNDSKNNKKMKLEKVKDKKINEQSITGASKLYTYCVQNKLVLPCYKIYETTDYTNKKLFYVYCNIKNFIETAVGNKKKEGKHKAANLLLAKLEANEKLILPLDEYNNADDLEEGEICELEEGEISETTSKYTSNIRENSKCDLIENDFLPMGDKKYKSYKVYLEGNVCRSNIISQQDLIETDIARLSDFCLEQQLPLPSYEIEEHNGFSVPIFTCKCTVLQLSVNSRGGSRSVVKNKASKMLLEKMSKLVDLLKPDDSVKKNKKYNKFDLEEGEILDEENESTKNVKGKSCDRRMQPIQFKNNKEQILRYLEIDASVSELYKYCMKLNIPPPTYEMVHKQKLTPVRSIVTFKCSVLRFSRVGKGTTKRLAVHRAASRVLQILVNRNKDEVDKKIKEKDDYSDLEENESANPNDEVFKKAYTGEKLQGNYVSHQEKENLQILSITNCHNIIKTEIPYTNSILIKNLKEFDDTVLKNNALLILEYLCKELQCTYDLYDFRAPTCCIASVSLNTKPSWAFFGEGNSKINAELHAISQLLKFLKVMRM